MSDFVIQQSTNAELIADVIAASFADVALRFGLTRENCPSHTSFITVDAVRTGMALGSTFYIAYAGNTACGCVGVRQPKNGGCVIEKLAVLPPYRRLGMGRALMERAFLAVRRAGARRAEIGIIEAHHDLRRWYENLGFRALRSEHYEHLPFSVLHMEKTLAPR